MKKLFALFTLACTLMLGQGVYAQDTGCDVGQEMSGQDIGGYQDNSCCQDNGSVDMATGDCYCKRVCYKTCYCKVRRCEYQTKCYQKRHCRWVCQQYEKPCVKYVPVCSTETRSRYVPEYYYTEETRQVPVWKCEIVEKQVPRYYYQHVCQPEGGSAAPEAPAQACCQ